MPFTVISMATIKFRVVTQFFERKGKKSEKKNNLILSLMLRFTSIRTVCMKKATHRNETSIYFSYRQSFEWKYANICDTSFGCFSCEIWPFLPPILFHITFRARPRTDRIKVKPLTRKIGEKKCTWQRQMLFGREKKNTTQLTKFFLSHFYPNHTGQWTWKLNDSNELIQTCFVVKMIKSISFIRYLRKQYEFQNFEETKE